MRGITVTSAAAAVACCLAVPCVTASLPSSTGTFGIVKNHAFSGLNSRGGAVGKFFSVRELCQNEDCGFD